MGTFPTAWTLTCPELETKPTAWVLRHAEQTTGRPIAVNLSALRHDARVRLASALQLPEVCGLDPFPFPFPRSFSLSFQILICRHEVLLGS